MKKLHQFPILATYLPVKGIVLQNVPGSDGFGDDPYFFENKQDNYPRMNPSFQIEIEIIPGSNQNSINRQAD